MNLPKQRKKESNAVAQGLDVLKVGGVCQIQGPADTTDSVSFQHWASPGTPCDDTAALGSFFIGAGWYRVFVFFLEAFLESFLAVFLESFLAASAEHMRFTLLAMRACDYGSSWL